MKLPSKKSLIALAVGLALSSAVTARTVFATCDQVVDGDTFYIQIEGDDVRQRARLAGIDCPEPRQRMGSKAKANLKIFLYGKRLEVEILGRDKESEELVVLVDAEGVDPARTQSAQGLAWLNPDDFEMMPKDKLELYDNLIYEAQVSHWGIWKERKPDPPWVFRAKQKSYN